jgi:hypothetical protein
MHLDTTSFHVDGRYNNDKKPQEQVVHITKGYMVAIIARTSGRAPHYDEATEWQQQ